MARTYRVNGRRVGQKRELPPQTLLNKSYKFAQKFARDSGVTIDLSKSEFEMIVNEEYATGLYQSKKEAMNYVSEKIVRDITNTYGKDGEIQTLSRAQAVKNVQVIRDKLGVNLDIYQVMTGQVDIRPYIQQLSEQAAILGIATSRYIYGS